MVGATGDDSLTPFANISNRSAHSRGDWMRDGLEVHILKEYWDRVAESTQTDQTRFRSVLMAARIIDAAEAQARRRHAELLKTWREQVKQRENEIRDAADGKSRLLQVIAWRTIAGMMLCWVAQWLV